ncbi:helix-turn-helix transcriptional regulator [candidate division WOR-3 bacterium]|nr:helix-turn-helix transcriptional regulator [candidate division WOR-3 bacterium]
MRSQIKPEDQRIIKTLKYIQVNYNRKLTLKEIADYVRLSPEHLCRLFKQSMGATLFGYVNNLRLEKAEELVRNNKNQLKNVAYAIGLTPKYFWKLFKDKNGISPSEYVENNKRL